MKEKKEKESSEEKKREKEYSERFRKLKEEGRSGREKIRELKEYRNKQKELEEGAGLPFRKEIYGKPIAKERAKQVGRGVLSAGTYIERTSERIGSALASQFKKPMLKKPSVSIKTISSKGILKQFAGTHYGEIKEGRSYSEQPTQDNRSMFFNETLKREKQNNRGWL
jgi:hypothetical protein